MINNMSLIDFIFVDDTILSLSTDAFLYFFIKNIDHDIIKTPFNDIEDMQKANKVGFIFKPEYKDIYTEFVEQSISSIRYHDKNGKCVEIHVPYTPAFMSENGWNTEQQTFLREDGSIVIMINSQITDFS